MAFDPDEYTGPFHELLGLDIESASGGHAVVRLELSERHSSQHATKVAQGGVVFTLADFCGGLALMSLAEEPVPTPTIDMRIDYLRPATTDLHAEGRTLRYGRQTGVAQVDVLDTEDRTVATARGVYKTSALPKEAPWAVEEE